MSQQDVIEAPTQVGKIGRVLLESGRLTEQQAERAFLGLMVAILIICAANAAQYASSL